MSFVSNGSVRSSLMRKPLSRHLARRAISRACTDRMSAQPMEPRCLLSASPADLLAALPKGTYGVNAPAGLEIGINPNANANTPQYLMLDNAPQVLSDGTLAPFATAGPHGLSPTQVRKAYGVSQILFGSIQGDGTGQTIAIVDAYDYPTVNSDLHNFDVAFGLPDTIVRRVNQDGGSTLPSIDTTSPKGDDWEVEEALDVEWAHAMAPKASILLVEANTNSNDDLIAHGVNFARSVPGVSAISMSFGVDGGFAGESFYDQFFTTPVGHAGVTFLASTGDSGAPGGYPAESPNVLAVGGTTLNVTAGGTYLSETGWSNGGGGISQFESQPGYQVSTVSQTHIRRAIPDVSLVADPATGVSIFDSVDFGTATPWIVVGGTSLSSPAWAGLIAIANQGRAIANINNLGGADSVQQHLYDLPVSAFHDITVGFNGFNAAPGYDLVTGLGSPRANLLIPELNTVPSLVFTTQPSNVLPHHIISPAITVALEDQFGTVETNLTSTVTITLSSGPGTLGGTLTEALVGGVATFSDLTVSAAGNYTLTVSDPAAGVGTTVSNVFIVNAPPTQIVFSTQPGTSVAGQPISGPVTVKLEDANGTVINDDAPVTLAVASGPGALSGTITLNAVNGVATFDSAVLTKSGTYVLTATDSLDLLAAVNSSSFVVNPAAAATLAFLQPLSNLVAGSTISPAVLVAVEDAYGNVVPSASANITLSISTGPGLLSGSTTAATSGGIATFGSVVITKSGDYVLTATDAADTLILNSNTFTVTPGAAVHLLFLNPPTTITAGQAFSSDVTAELTDAFGNIATNNVSNITISVASGPGALLGSTTLPVTSGEVDFTNLVIKKAGVYRLRIDDAGLNATSGTFTVNLGTAAQAVFVQQPTAITTGGSFNLVMQVQDSAGNFLPTSNAPVKLSLVGAPAGARLNGTLSTRAVNGIVTLHNVSLVKPPGYFTLGATVPGNTTGYSAPIIVSGPAAKLAVTKQPPVSVKAGTALSAVTVNILDAFGHVAADDSAVTVSLIGSNGVLGGTKTLHAVNGVVTFNGLTISQAGSYSLRFTDGKLQTVNSRAITVTPSVSPAAQLAAAKKKKAVPAPTIAPIKLIVSSFLRR